MKAVITTTIRTIIIDGLLLLLFSGAGKAAELAPGYTSVQHAVPVAGSYSLPALFPAADGKVLDSHGQHLQLHPLLAGHLTVLAFIYTSCNDVNGCPLAVHVLQRIAEELQAIPALQSQVRLLTLSFDPVHDTPQVLEAYSTSVRKGEVDWRFLTTESPAISQDITHAYHQSVDMQSNENGRISGQIAHALRIFLIDGQHQVRQIYNSSTLKAELVLADLQTLSMQQSPQSLPANTTDQPVNLSLAYRHTMTGLPPLAIPRRQIPSERQIALGRKLFYDRRLSQNNTLSCGMCHIPDQGFTSQEQKTSVGIEGRTVRRNAPTLYNIAYARRLFVDSREFSLENQAWGPLLARNEMGNPSPGFVIERLRGLKDYSGLFEQAFGHGPDMQSIGQALSAYERTLVSGDSPFDRWYYRQEADAISPQAQNGFRLFTGKAGCSQCHNIGSQDALFTDHRLHDTGIGYRSSMQTLPASVPIHLAPGLEIQMAGSQIMAVGEAPPSDLGAYEVTLNPGDRWKFRTPTLRNIALTAPYMHDGSLASLRDVIMFYHQGGVPHEGQDILISPLQLDGTDIDALVAFLQTLTGSNVGQLVRDGQRAPVGDPQTVAP
ncbi:MAG: hypothetical protein RIQ52_405 [Pseudomonadota bacterium]